MGSQRPQAQKVALSKAQRGPAPAQRGPAPAQKGPAPAFSDSQKLQLKSQILAYRLLGRFEAMLPVVRGAATSRSLKSLGLPKDEMRILSRAFNQEYSSAR